MNCEYFRILISSGLDDELTIDEKSKVAQHLSECPECVEFKQAIGDLNITASQVHIEKMPPDLEENILKATVKSRPRNKSFFDFAFGFYKVPRGLVWLGVCALVIIAFNSFTTESDSGAKATISIQPVESILTVQKIVITEQDIVASSSMKKDNSI